MKNSQYRFKRNHILKMDKLGDGNICNNNMTDEKAIAFLKVNPARIKLFSKYPDDWNDTFEEEASKDVKAASEAIIEAIEDAEGVKKICTPCEKKKLEGMKMGELKETYPEAKVEFGMKKADLINNIILQYYSNESTI